MIKFEDIADVICGLWIVVILFLTFPLWVIPYIVYNRIKNR